MVRSQLRACVLQGTSASLIFLDLTEAFYRVLRPLALGGKWYDQMLAAMAARLNLDDGALHDLRARLAEPGGLIELVYRLSREPPLDLDPVIHLLTLCSVFFGHVLCQLEDSMAQLGLLTYLPKPTHCSISAEMSDEMVPFLGPTWCDDLCICVSHDTPRGLESKTATTLNLIFDLCREHGMSPNFKCGKTEIVFSFRWRGLTCT